MSCPLTSIANPLNPKEVYLFYLTQNKGTGLEIYKYPEPKKVDVTNFVDNIKVAPEDDVIVNPGSFTSQVAHGMLNVYGLVRLPGAVPKPGEKAGAKKEVDATDTKLVAQLSPVFKFLMLENPSKVKGVALTTTIDKRGQSWLYAMTTNESENPAIKAIKLGWKETTVASTITPKVGPQLASNLAAFHDPLVDRNFIIYQDKKALHIVDGGGQEDKEVPNTKDARAMTGLACVTVPSIKGGVQVLLYYFASSGELQRVVRDEKGKWGISESRDDKESEESTFLTATLLGDSIAIHYVLKGDTSKFYTILDPIVSPEPEPEGNA